MGIKKGKNQQGNAILVVIVFLALGALSLMSVAAMNSMREYRSLDKSFAKSNEKWTARSNVNIISAAISNDVPKMLDADVRTARTECNINLNVSIFDEVDTTESVPAVARTANGFNCNAGIPTSIFGNFSNWKDGILPAYKSNIINQFNLDPNLVEVVEFNQIFERSIGSSKAYGARYIVEGKIGNYRTRSIGEVLLGNKIPNCGTSVSIEAVPALITEGDSFALNVQYTYGNSLEIYNGNVLVHSEAVSEQSANQTFTFNASPTSTTNYRVVVNGSGGCSAQSSIVSVTVIPRPPICPTISSFNASSQTITSGNSVTLTWNVQDASSVTLDGVVVAASGTQTFTLTANRTFILVAQPTNSGCAAADQQISITVQPAPCAFSAPSITQFTPNNASIALGENFQLTWNVSGIQSGGTVLITGANGYSQVVGASGTTTITPPNAVGNYTYTITSENICPDGTRLTSTQSVVIQVRACPPPTINAFAVSPTTASAGIGTINFSWSISGTADSVFISNGVGSGLPASGSMDINTPNVGGNYNYTLSVVGCGQTRTQTVNLPVTSCNPPTIQSFTGSPALVTVGGNQTVTFNWTSTADCGGTATIDNGVGAVPLNGNISIIQPQVTTTYTLTVNSPGGTITRQFTIVVQPPVSVSCSTSIDLTFENPEATRSGSISLVLEPNVPVGSTTAHVNWDPQPFNYLNNGEAGLQNIHITFYDNVNGYNFLSSTIIPTPYTVTEANFNSGSKVYVFPVVFSTNMEFGVTMEWATFLSGNPGEIFYVTAGGSKPCN